MGVDFLDRRVLAKRVVDGRKPASGHESQLRQGVASAHPQGRSAAKEPQSGLTRRNPLTFDPTCCGFSHSLFSIYVRFYAAVNNRSPVSVGLTVTGLENRVSTLGSASATPGRANLRTKIAFVFVRPARCRHGFAPSRHALTPTASGLMTARAPRQRRSSSESPRKREMGSAIVCGTQRTGAPSTRAATSTALCSG